MDIRSARLGRGRKGGGGTASRTVARGATRGVTILLQSVPKIAPRENALPHHCVLHPACIESPSSIPPPNPRVRCLRPFAAPAVDGAMRRSPSHSPPRFVRRRYHHAGGAGAPGRRSRDGRAGPHRADDRRHVAVQRPALARDRPGAWRPFGRRRRLGAASARVLDGTTGGGVYKTTDAGMSWQPATDRYFGGTIGAIAVDHLNPDIVWVGGGETDIRGNTSHGDGLWKTTDGGRTWQMLGFKEEYISTIRIHPDQPERRLHRRVWGRLQGDQQPRRLQDDGRRQDLQQGAVRQRLVRRDRHRHGRDQPRDALYVAMWQAWRAPWGMSSGGLHSGLFKTTDGGATWSNLVKTAKGLPQGNIGKIGLTVSPVNPQLVWALIEHDSGGVYKSNDGGANWRYINRERKLRQRAWYYSQIYADPKDTNIVYGLNVGFFRSNDGGKTFPASINPPHGDNHDLWIAPNDNHADGAGERRRRQRLVHGGRAWTAQTFPTAQFYHVDVHQRLAVQHLWRAAGQLDAVRPRASRGRSISGLVRCRRLRVGLHRRQPGQAEHHVCRLLWRQPRSPRHARPASRAT
jgi:photosystem II stability/assembly factor-like uncharacterized protein